MAIHISEQVPLTEYTTMRVGGKARYFALVKNIDEIRQAVDFANERKLNVLILGGGSNMIISDDGFDGLVIKMEILGIDIDHNILKVGAGEVWDDVVSGAVTRGLWGIENLSLIPGSVGGAVVQNIGAYGVEAKEIIFSVDAFDIDTMQVKTFLNSECEFGYRESIFKKNKNLIVTSVTFELKENGIPKIDYEDVKKYFSDKKIITPSLDEIREAIVSIRGAKMPAPPIGTAGSFFKNPVISVSQYNTLKTMYPDIKAYSQGDNDMKLSAAWLIDHIGGFRGVRRKDAGVHEKQALILVNYGNANAEEIFLLAKEIKDDINKKINVSLEEEVVVV